MENNTQSRYLYYAPTASNHPNHGMGPGSSRSTEPIFEQQFVLSQTSEQSLSSSVSDSNYDNASNRSDIPYFGHVKTLNNEHNLQSDPSTSSSHSTTGGTYFDHGFLSENIQQNGDSDHLLGWFRHNNSTPQFQAPEDAWIEECGVRDQRTPISSSTAAKPYTCNYCRRPFARKGDMIRHSRIHEPPILFCREEGCKYRRKGFSRKDRWISHLKKHGVVVNG